MNSEYFGTLSEEKKVTIKRAYNEAYSKRISPSQFFEICKDTLTSSEYSRLFSEPSQQEEVKTDAIEDIMQYSGVDLKEEESRIAEYTQMDAMHADEDRDSYINSFFNSRLFKNFVTKICDARNVKITKEGIQLLFLTMKRKLYELCEKLNDASKMRVELAMADYEFTIDNETSKQLWYLNELERVKGESLSISKSDEGKKKKPVAEREDIAIKKRQSNVMAMQALGVKQLSWMSTDKFKQNEEVAKYSSIYAPFDEKQLEEKFRLRMITAKDFMFVLEKDKLYNKSIFVVQNYFK